MQAKGLQSQFPWVSKLNQVCGSHQVKHFVFFTASLSQTDLINVKEFPLPYPSKFKDAWDDVSVKMPCSEKNLFPVETEVQVDNKS